MTISTSEGLNVPGIGPVQLVDTKRWSGSGAPALSLLFFMLDGTTIGISGPFGGRLRLNRLARKFVRKAPIQSKLYRYQPLSRTLSPVTTTPFGQLSNIRILKLLKMVSYYQIAGKQVGSHYLAMAVLGSMAGIVTLSTRGGSAAKKDSTPPINAKSPDEEKYIKEFMASIEGGKSGNNVDSTKKDAGR
ncbi:hypothetical protein sscle_10g077380 [Sclerotinia sclerotiorum 1980 UF-70]|uniref:ATP synthase subunit K, mitochondrial n=2 Tax=Sclerotinia sclerotiorum (strain ATCC 18683 / 1980 / Ss-1) TaxID=665079 RepID=A0A1D9QDJ4_SCLS1|nr:hypothetical protein sscle_10g077380 [Sclerotinia sclerotiorum 1980 UF-70]